MEYKRTKKRISIALGIVVIAAVNMFGQTKTGVRIAIDDILQANKATQAWAVAPQSIRITGTSDHEGIVEPITITATGKEESLILYGFFQPKTQVATTKSFFKDDGSNVVRQPTLAGFTQLDITGVFLLEQLKSRPIKVGLGEPVSPAGPRPIYRVHILNDSRSETHYGSLKVADEMDLFVSDSGLLLGIERTFYPQSPVFKATLRTTFSDFRDAGGVILPYQIEKSINKVVVERIQVASYAFDVTTSTTLFEARKAR